MVRNPRHSNLDAESTIFASTGIRVGATTCTIGTSPLHEASWFSIAERDWRCKLNVSGHGFSDSDGFWFWLGFTLGDGAGFDEVKFVLSNRLGKCEQGRDEREEGQEKEWCFELHFGDCEIEIGWIC